MELRQVSAMVMACLAASLNSGFETGCLDGYIKSMEQAVDPAEKTDVASGEHECGYDA